MEEADSPRSGSGRIGEFEQRETSVAIIGRPNVGKSTLLNALTGTTRAIVSPIAGTTRDAVDEVVEFEGNALRFVDTAGIRRKGKTKLMAEKMSVVMARRHLEAADVALLVIDATEGVTASDATIGGYAHESGRSVIIVVNKWDLVTTARTDGKKPADREIFEKQVRGALKYLDYAPVIFLVGAGSDRAGAEGHDARAARGGGGGQGAAQARVDGRDEPVPGEDRFSARAGADGEENQDFLYDAGGRGSANVCAVYGSRDQAALCVRAVFGEPDSRGVRIQGDAGVVQGEGAEREERSIGRERPPAAPADAALVARNEAAEGPAGKAAADLLGEDQCSDVPGVVAEGAWEGSRRVQDRRVGAGSVGTWGGGPARRACFKSFFNAHLEFCMGLVSPDRPVRRFGLTCPLKTLPVETGVLS